MLVYSGRFRAIAIDGLSVDKYIVCSIMYQYINRERGRRFFFWGGEGGGKRNLLETIFTDSVSSCITCHNIRMYSSDLVIRLQLTGNRLHQVNLVTPT